MTARLRFVVTAAGFAVCMASLIAPDARAVPVVPTHDDEVIEVLPAITGNRSEERRLRRQLAEQPRDPVLALAVARQQFEQAHALGDPRFAGMALAAISPWTDEATMPDDLLLMRATLQQYLHEFNPAVANLKRLLARPGPPRPQAWLTLATVLRVQGHYAESDVACQQVARAGAAMHATACGAENAALRGQVERSRLAFTTLIADARGDPSTTNWLTTSLAELEQRAGNVAAADTAYRAALRAEPDAYTTLAYADFLIEQKHPAQALAVLKGQVRSDPVLLRLAIAGTQAHAASAAADVAEMRERIALANERPEAKVLHGREQAMFALAIDGDAALALSLSRGNVAQQREPLDLLVFAQAARASGDVKATQEARDLANSIGLQDQRIKALL